MGKIEEINKMSEQGRSEAEIVSALRQKGVSESEAYDLISQSQIKEAVSSDEELGVPSPEGSYSGPQVVEYGEESSMVAAQGQAQQEYAPQEYSAQQPQQYSSGEYAPGGNVEQGQSYSISEQYQPYQEAISSDVITEISEQVVSEKLAGVEEKLTKILNFKAVSETKISALDERLKRIEQILDRLQLSILQRVGEYVADVKDLKKELVETQTSFKKLNHGGHHSVSHSHSEHAQHHSSQPNHSEQRHQHHPHAPPHVEHHHTQHHPAHHTEHHAHHETHHSGKGKKNHSSHEVKLDLRKKYP